MIQSLIRLKAKLRTLINKAVYYLLMTTANKQYWKNIAQEYDKNVGEKGDSRHEKIINPVVFNLLGDLSGKIILDAGCGNGYLSRRLAKTAFRVIGIDFTPELIKIAKSNNNPPNTEFIEGNLEKLPFSESIYDVILCNMVLMDVERLDKVVAELSRVLKQNGAIVVSITHPCFENPPRTYSLFDNEGIRIGRVIKKYFEIGLIMDTENKINNYPYLHYHYMVSDYINIFAQENLFVDKMVEPNGYETDKNIGMNPDTPTFLLMRFVKKD